MTKKRVLPVKKYQTATFPVQDTLLKTPAACMPTNLAEEKEKFLKSGQTPKFHLKDRSKVEELASKAKNHIRFELLGEAQYILEKVRDTYGHGELYLEHAYGPRIIKDEATPLLLKYIAENNVPESLKIHWCDNLTCSAKMVWTGPNVNSNRPELRRYSLWLNGSDENPYMRESGIRCLMDHEIGTHFYRSFNDGFQPWYAERERFGLRKLGAFEGHCTEEGLAAIHTALRGRVRYFWGAAMAYYIACKSAEMTFKELFDHLARYTPNPDYRWKQAMRVKRGLADPNDLGGFGNDQCYFEGAVNILRKMDDIDFQLLMMGKICYDELDRIKRVVRKDVVQYPNFMKNMSAYRKTLRKMLIFNGLDGLHPQRGPPDVYLKHLDEKKNGKTHPKSKKVRSNAKLSMLAKTVNNKGKNKKASKSTTTKDELEKEVESFKCSQPFINMHLRKKSILEIEQVFKSNAEKIVHVQELTNDISIKDSTIEKQLEKFHDIIKHHKWASNEAMYKDNLIEEVKGEYIPEKGAGDSSILPPIKKYSCPLRDENSITYDSEIDNEVKIEIKGNLCLVDQSPETNESHSCSLCSSASSHSVSIDNNQNGQFICDDGNGIPLPTLGTLEQSETQRQRQVSGNSFKNLLSRNKTTSNDKSHQGRKVLHTPAADLSGYDSFVAHVEHNIKTVTDTPPIKKRISLFTNTTAQETKMNGIENIGNDTNIQLQLSKESIHQLDTPDLCIKMKGDHSQCNSPSKENNIVRNISNPPMSHRETDIYQSINVPKNRFGFNVQQGKSVINRPMSSGSERILKFHWMNFSTNKKPAEKRTLPSRPSLKAILNFDNNISSNDNNSFTAFKFKNKFKSTNRLYQNTFH